jgi:cephalosporin hydroxylase
MEDRSSAGLENKTMKTSELVSKAMEIGAVQVPEELAALIYFLRPLNLRNVLEIGSEAGGTFYLWCQLATLGGLKISVDDPRGSSGSGRFSEEAARAARAAQMKRWSANVHVITGDSHQRDTWNDVNDLLCGEKLDFLFIDGDHSYAGVKMDFEDYRRFVRPGGLVGFHDINDSEFHRKRGCFVSHFWSELQGVKVEFNQGLEWGGIGVITV